MIFDGYIPGQMFKSRPISLAFQLPPERLYTLAPLRVFREYICPQSGGPMCAADSGQTGSVVFLRQR